MKPIDIQTECTHSVTMIFDQRQMPRSSSRPLGPSPVWPSTEHLCRTSRRPVDNWKV